MTIDWVSLQQRARRYSPAPVVRTLKALKDTGGPEPVEVNEVTTIIATGLRLSLSEVLKLRTPGRAPNVHLFADTVILDDPQPPVLGLQVMARVVDISPLSGRGLTLTPQPRRRILTRWLIGSLAGGLGLPIHPSDSSRVLSAAGALRRTDIALGEDKVLLAAEHSQGRAVLEDILSAPWAHNSYRATYAAAIELLHENGEEQREQGCAMMMWLTRCIEALEGAGSGTAELDAIYAHAATILLQIRLPPRTYHLPVYHYKAYREQLGQTLVPLRAYEADLAKVQGTIGSQEVIAQISAGLQRTAAISQDPLRAELTLVSQEIASIEDSIAALEQRYLIHQMEIQRALSALESALVDQKAFQTFKASVMLGIHISSALSAHGKAEGAEGIMEHALKKDAVEGATKAMEDLSEIYSAQGDKLPPQDKARIERFLSGRRGLLRRVVRALQLWRRPADRALVQAAAQDPLDLNKIDVDQNWDSFLTQVRAESGTIRDRIGDGIKSGSSREASRSYQAALESLAVVGRTIDSKLVALTSLMARGTILRAQMTAAQETQASWSALQKDATGVTERQQVLRTLIQGRVDALTRLMVSTFDTFSDALYYSHFVEAPHRVHGDMRAAEWDDVLAALDSWLRDVENPGAGGSAEGVELLKQDVRLELSLPIHRSGDPAPAEAAATLSSEGPLRPQRLDWSIPLDHPKLKAQIPPGVAIWIQSAEFFLDGVRLNAAQRVKVRVATSGAYQQPQADGQAARFLGRRLAASYGYAHEEGKPPRVYDPWKASGAVYQPSPFTQWTMTFADSDAGDPAGATRLRMELVVSYRNPPPTARAPHRQS